MGTHPNAPAVLLQHPLTLHQLVTSDSDRFLGPNLTDLPFLFKVLSVKQALSIQAHPNRFLAQQLHATQPNQYKDANHKPEMAIALTTFETLFGFRPVMEILDHLNHYPELREVVGSNQAKVFCQQPCSEGIKHVLEAILTCSSELVNHQLKLLMERIQNSKQHLDQLLRRVHQQYPGDVGVFCIFLMNHVILKPGEALYMGANKLHAYLNGGAINFFFLLFI